MRTKHVHRVAWTLVRVALAVLLVAWFAIKLRTFDRYIGFTPPGWVRIPGILLLVSGGLLALACGGVLSTRGILKTPGDRIFPTDFLGSGPFRYLRNPMSLGAVGIFVGLGLVEQSVSILLFSLLLFLAFHLLAVYVEEPGLEKRFGQCYLDLD